MSTNLAEVLRLRDRAHSCHEHNYTLLRRDVYNRENQRRTRFHWPPAVSPSTMTSRRPDRRTKMAWRKNPSQSSHSGMINRSTVMASRLKLPVWCRVHRRRISVVCVVFVVFVVAMVTMVQRWIMRVRRKRMEVCCMGSIPPVLFVICNTVNWSRRNLRVVRSALLSGTQSRVTLSYSVKCSIVHV